MATEWDFGAFINTIAAPQAVAGEQEGRLEERTRNQPKCVAGRRHRIT
jgi:hypothetical protein